MSCKHGFLTGGDSTSIGPRQSLRWRPSRCAISLDQEPMRTLGRYCGKLSRERALLCQHCLLRWRGRLSDAFDMLRRQEFPSDPAGIRIDLSARTSISKMREIIAKAQQLPGPGDYEADTDSLLARQRRLADRCVFFSPTPALALSFPHISLTLALRLLFPGRVFAVTARKKRKAANERSLARGQGEGAVSTSIDKDREFRYLSPQHLCPLSTHFACRCLLQIMLRGQMGVCV